MYNNWARPWSTKDVYYATVTLNYLGQLICMSTLGIDGQRLLILSCGRATLQLHDRPASSIDDTGKL